jgi:hypothetical protein
MNIHLVEAEFFHEDGRRDRQTMTNLTVDYCNYVSTTKKNTVCADHVRPTICDKKSYQSVLFS